ncbi:hypothetical protein OSB04_028729 [Centaurea solstitialis]|uniref:Uncharacterized protein n=1 Tax=Centaurea solstitialis TaxID=347529 RepID=A0AA38SNQ5_9ASTR|nr:hypothetical protein OSB04_028729 [Centaurea solstitialis]
MLVDPFRVFPLRQLVSEQDSPVSSLTAYRQLTTTTDLAKMNVAVSTTLANLTATVNRLQPSSVNDNRHRRNRFEGPVKSPRNGYCNWVSFSSSKSKEDEEEGLQEKIDVALQRVLLSSKEESQHHNLFRSYCSVQKKVCNLVIDGRSSENLVSRKLVGYFNLPTQPYEAPYSLEWVDNGLQVCNTPYFRCVDREPHALGELWGPTRVLTNGGKGIHMPLCYKVIVTHTCPLPISIGKHYQEEILCDVLDMDVCHIMLGRSWQFDNYVTYKSQDNIVIFRCGDRKITMRGINGFAQKPPEKNEVLPNKVEGVVVLESQCEAYTGLKDSTTDFMLGKGGKGEVIEGIPEPPQEIVSVVL